VAVSVRADIRPGADDEPGDVETRVRSALTRFLHPVSGGADEYGWTFGRGIYLSDVAALVCGIRGVAAVESLRLMVGQVIYGDAIPIAPHQLVCAGEMQLKLIVPSVPYALT